MYQARNRIIVLITVFPIYCATSQARAQLLLDSLHTFGTSGSDRISDIAIDADGNSYVGGTMKSPTSSLLDIHLVKYDPTGAFLWSQTYDLGSTENLGGVDLGPDGHVYLTGSTGTGIGINALTMKCTQQGGIVWVRTYDGGSYDGLGCAAFDSQGNVYVCGVSEFQLVGGVPPGPTTQLDWLVIKYNSAGVHQWTRNYNMLSTGDDGAWSIHVNSAGNIIVTGEAFRTGTGRDLTTVQYDPAGQILWEAHYNGPTNPNEAWRGAELGADDNIVVTGASGGAIATVKYNSAGVEQWARRFTGASAPYTMALDTAGNAYVVGLGGNSQSGVYWTTIKYDPEGEVAWTANLPSGVTGNNSPGDITVDDGGFVYVTGQTQGTTPLGQCTTVMYGPGGEELWSASYDGPYNRPDRGTHILTTADGGLIVAGSLQQTPSNTDWLILRYVPGCTGDCRADELRNGADISAFVQCLAAPGCPCADMNLDGAFNQTDVQLFLTVLINGADCPGI